MLRMATLQLRSISNLYLKKVGAPIAIKKMVRFETGEGLWEEGRKLRRRSYEPIKIIEEIIIKRNTEKIKVFLFLFYAVLSSSNGSNNNLISISSADAILDNVAKEKVFLQALFDSIFRINS